MAKGTVAFEQDKCKGCGLCVSVCPKKIITLFGQEINQKGYHYAYVANMAECIACANCAVMCPDSIISVEKI